MDAPDEKTESYKDELLSGYDHEMSKAREVMFGTKLDLTIMNRQFHRFGASGADVYSLLEELEEQNPAASNSDSSDNECYEASTDVKVEPMDVSEEQIRKRRLELEAPYEERDSNSNFSKRTKSDKDVKTEAPEPDNNPDFDQSQYMDGPFE